MRVKLLGIAALSLSLLAGAATDAQAGRRVRTFGDKGASRPEAAARPNNNNKAEKPFAEMIKDKVAVDGLFTFYQDTTDNSWLMAIKPDQFGPVYLLGQTRSAAEGAFFDNGSMGESFPFYLKRVGKSVQILEKNLRIQADSASPSFKAVKSGISDHLWASTAVKSLPNDSGAVLIDPSDLFVQDAQNLSYFMGQAAQMGIRFDQKNSYFQQVKSFPQNSEIDVRLHYATSKPMSGETMQNPYSMFHTIHYSLSTLPETDYVPRLADDRLGYFQTMYMDYTSMDSYSPYVRYINRWDLKKKNPDARISEPVEPIVFWVENTWPEEYRDAVAEGIEFWNVAFEKIGFRNAIVAKQMPDTADWDPADVRYNTVRWMVMPGGGYAVGPSRANPFTGQIYDADIRVSADFLRYMFNNMEYFIKPVSFDGISLEAPDPMEEWRKFYEANGYMREFHKESAQEAAFGLTYLLAAAGSLADKDEITREYVHSYLVELVAHEVGHTLGLRHNYKASTIYSLDQICDRDFTCVKGTSGSIMDYTPPNIAPEGMPQGEFYASVPGPYDNWVIEYGYSEFGDVETPMDEWDELQAIAGRAADPLLVYGTDEDAFGTSTRGIDPQCLIFDHGNDNVRYCENKVGMTKRLWMNSLDDFERDGEGYQTVLRAFQTGWRAYSEAAGFIARYIGGVYHNRYHVGDTVGVTPFTPVPASEQRRAMKFLEQHIFAADAFDLPADLVNKLQPERHSDFRGSLWTAQQIDYPLHEVWLGVQNATLSRLYDPLLLGRLRNNVARVEPTDDKYTMYNMFTDVRGSIWSELSGAQEINSFRRQLQLLHLKRLVQIYLSDSAVFPSDARTLAANDLDVIETAAQRAVGSGKLDGMTQAHCKEVLRQIDAAKGAKREYSSM